MASGQAAMLRKRNTTELTNPFSVQTLTRLLHLLDVLTQNTYIDATDSGPFFLHSLLRIVPPKLPIDLRPVMLRIIHRLALGMSRDRRPEGKCFDIRHVIAMVHALNPILENPRSGASASFVVHEIKATLETCLQREMDCQSAPLRISTPKLDIEFGMIESDDTERLSDLGPFRVPSLLGISPKSSCLGYRSAIFKSNLMRNGSVDHSVYELAFRNASMVLAPSFRTKSINFTLPLSAEFSRRVSKGGRPQCVWYEREANATVSRWSDRGCSVLGFNRRQVNCSCNHLTEFSVMIPELARPFQMRQRWWILSALLSLVILIGCTALWSLYRRHQYEREVKLGLREPKHRRMHGPPTYQQHVLRSQWRLRDSDEGTLFMDDQSRTLGSKSTLTPGDARTTRTASMASTVYLADGESTAVEDDDTDYLDDFDYDKEFSAEGLIQLEKRRPRLAPEQLRPYRHLPSEQAITEIEGVDVPAIRRLSDVNATSQSEATGLRRRSAEDRDHQSPDDNVFKEAIQPAQDDEEKQQRRNTLLNLLSDSLWNKKQ